MDFLEITSSEYNDIIKNLLWRTPFIHQWATRGALSTFFIIWLFSAVFVGYYIQEFMDILATFRVIANLGTILNAVLFGFVLAFAFCALYSILTVIFTPVRKLRYVRAHEVFVAAVRRLTEPQYDALLTEYPCRKKIEVYYDKKRKLIGSGVIYVTNNFLFVPGLLLVCREDLKEIKIIHGVKQIYRTGTKITKIRFVFTRFPSVLLPIKYDYENSPHTALQIMAWFWQCNPNDPALPRRLDTVFVHKDNYE